MYIKSYFALYMFKNIKNLQKLQNNYSKDGYVVIDQFFKINLIEELHDNIEGLIKSNEVNIYYDRSGRIRRMEKFIFKKDIFKLLNKKIMEIVFSITNEKQVLFKDKVNFKPPKGEGFYAHYDGIFQFKKNDNVLKNGWYEYTDDFNNVLIALDDFNIKNGTLEIAKKHNGTFKDLLENTKKNGTPDLAREIEKKCNFFPVSIKRGGIVIFKHTCPHRSGPNLSNSNRSSIYLTYTDENKGSFYKKYFIDKRESINKDKALLGRESS